MILKRLFQTLGHVIILMLHMHNLVFILNHKSRFNAQPSQW